MSKIEFTEPSGYKETAKNIFYHNSNLSNHGLEIWKIKLNDEEIYGYHYDWRESDDNYFDFPFQKTTVLSKDFRSFRLEGPGLGPLSSSYIAIKNRENKEIYKIKAYFSMGTATVELYLDGHTTYDWNYTISDARILPYARITLQKSRLYEGQQIKINNASVSFKASDSIERTINIPDQTLENKEANEILQLIAFNAASESSSAGIAKLKGFIFRLD